MACPKDKGHSPPPSTPDPLGAIVKSDVKTTASRCSTLYACTACGKCCTWHGYVRMNDEEIDRMAAFVGMSSDSFTQKYMTVTGDRRGLTLMEKSNGHCIFYDAEVSRCTVYPVRPKQCRDFPNKWNFPGFERQCPSIPLKYSRIRVEADVCRDAYFPQKKFLKSRENVS